MRRTLYMGIFLGAFLTRNLHRLIRHDIREVTLVDETHAREKVEISIPDFRAIVGEISGALQAANYPESALEHVSFVRRNVGPSNKNTRPRVSREGRSRRTWILSRKAGNGRSGPAGGSMGPRGAEDHDMGS